MAVPFKVVSALVPVSVAVACVDVPAVLSIDDIPVESLVFVVVVFLLLQAMKAIADKSNRERTVFILFF